MHATYAPVDDHTVKLQVQVDDEEMAKALDDAAASLSRQVSIKGFRKGKVPKSVLIAHLGGPEALRAEAIRTSLPDFYAHAVADTLIDPIGQPDITITGGEDDGPLSFDANVEIRPEVAVSGYRDLRVSIASPYVSDDEVDAQIDRFRETDAVLNDVDRPIVSGDLVTLDLRVTQIATGAEPLELTDYMYTVGSGSITEGVDELMLGLRAGEDLKVNGSQEMGVVATYEMHLKQVKERELPELTDEWVQENTEWTSVAEMRDNVVTQLRRRRIVEAQLSQRDNTLVALSELVPEVQVPETLIVAETNERLHDLGHRLGQQNLNLETFLSVTNQSSDDLLATLRRDAVRAVRVDLAMRALVREESLEPTEEEIEEELVKTAEAMGSTPEVLRRNLRDTGRVVAFNAEVAKIKASRWLNEHVTYVDPTGVEIDPELLRADQSDSLDA